MSVIDVTESIVIDRPIDEVFQYISDCENDIHWCPPVLEVRRTSGTANAAGSEYFMRHAPGGMKFKAKVTVDQLERPRLMRWTLVDAHCTLKGTYELADVDGGTQVTQRTEIDFRHLWKVITLPMRGYIAKDIAKNLREQFAHLKQVLEGAPAA